jgi:phage portal protein BeeE
VALRVNDVIRAMRMNPIDPYRGLGPIGSLIYDLEGDQAAAAYNTNLLNNGAQPGGIVEVPTNLDDKQWLQMVERWDENHGGVSNAGRVAFLEKGTWKDAKSWSLKELMMFEGRTFTKETLRTAWRYPKPLLGDVEDVNRANAEAAAYAFARTIQIPRLDRMRDALNTQFLPMFGSLGSGYEFDYDDPTPEDAEDKRATITANVSNALALVAAGADWDETLEAFHLPTLTKALTAVAGETDAEVARNVAELLQKAYLAVDVAITPEELRELANRAGAGLSGTFSAPAAPAPRELTASAWNRGEV